MCHRLLVDKREPAIRKETVKRHTDGHRADGQTDSVPDGQAEGETDRHPSMQEDEQILIKQKTNKHAQRKENRLANGDRHTNGHAHRHVDRHVDARS